MDIALRQLAEQAVDELLDGDELSLSDAFACPYLPGREARSAGFSVEGPIDGAIYRVLLDRGFRRSGHVFYRPRCNRCRECIPIRVPVAAFQPSKSMRRVIHRNVDLRVELAPAEPTREKHELFARYLAEQHDGTMSSDFASFVHFLYASPVPGGEFRYFAGHRLIGVSVVDLFDDAISSVYMYYDPGESTRSLGTLSILHEIEHCRLAGMAYYYLGYYVAGSCTMAYKVRFQPVEVLTPGGNWARYDQA